MPTDMQDDLPTHMPTNLQDDVPNDLPTHVPPAQRIRDIALARSGDKGNRATLSVIALDPTDYPQLERTLSAARVRALYAGLVQGEVQRHALPGLGALHFVLHGALGGGVTRSLALDAHGKTLSTAALDLPVDAH